MRIISTSYSKSATFTDPQQWLKKIAFYTGILEELALQHDVISIERISYEGQVKQNGVHYYFIRQQRRVVRFPFRMHRLVRRLRPDVVLVNGFIFPLQIIQLRLALGRRVKIIVLHRAEKPFKGIKKILQQVAGKCVNAFLFASMDFSSQWKNHMAAGKIKEVIQASSIFQPAAKEPARRRLGVDGNPLFLWVGNLLPGKDPLAVVRAFRKYLADQPEAKLYMLFQKKDLLAEVKEVIAGNTNIILTGEVNHEGLQDWFCAADFYISGSHYEGSGIALSEAMSCGCIPVVTNISSFRSMTANGQCGLLFEPGNEQDLLRVLHKTGSTDIAVEREKVLIQHQKELSFRAIAEKLEVIFAAKDQAAS